MRSENQGASSSILSWGLPLAISLSYICLSLQRDLRLSIPTLIGVTAIVVISLAILLYAGGREQLHMSPGVVIFFALLFRLLFVFRVPELSDDIYRYLWDGLQTLRGINPYSLAPAAAKLSDANSAVLLARINHPEMVTIYPPVSQMVFAVGAAITHSLTGMKIFLVALDIVTCAIMLKLLGALGLPAWRGALYAWHPLPVMEIAGSGHIDGVAVLLLAIGCLCLFRTEGTRKETSMKHRGNVFLAGAILSASVLVKFIPLIYLPFLVMAARKRATLLLFGSGIALLLFSIPFVPKLHLMFSTLTIYLQNWEFSNFLFQTLRSLISSGDHARILLGLLLCACLSVLGAYFYQIRPSLGERFSHLLLLKTMYGATFAFLLLMPTLYPWYVLYLVALFPFVCGPSGLIFSSAVFLSYGVLIDYALVGKWAESPFSAAGIWCSPILAFLASSIAKRFGTRLDLRS
jgi:hypothetical protein